MNRGAPKGNQNASKGKVWREALDKAIKQYVDKPAGIERGQALFRIATNVVKQALEGNPQAITEIGNRLDGKPHQSMDIGHHDLPAEEMTDDELIAIASSARAARKKGGKKKPARVH